MIERSIILLVVIFHLTILFTKAQEQKKLN